MTQAFDVSLSKARRAVRHMSAAHTMVLAIHGEPTLGGCQICEWLRTTAASVTELEGIITKIETPSLFDAPAKEPETVIDNHMVPEVHSPPVLEGIEE